MAAAQDLQSVPGVATPPDPATKDFIFQQASVLHAATQCVLGSWNHQRAEYALMMTHLCRPCTASRTLSGLSTFTHASLE